ncbi:hypothetical protein SEA_PHRAPPUCCINO_58 [Mycobacterium phage Phrappuccino]|uniref:Uncharacterized protein n=1 Tax=Mycobacterium phage Phrappuccino TaxID=2591223 RepID=A0A514DDP1_9CAUD|nr:hypothetical protein KHQ87_gp058 [Mycobacterium phage Phrappuccino]QDH91733.1 hypothetical protein SEA_PHRAPPUCCINO_58 [Mycobacterium phage Phrappuccino]QIQ63176.1 hypothetical protein SEA_SETTECANDELA_58 [Mycobacterium phage Settecandela]
MIMERPQTYREAADWFVEGKLTFDQLHDAMGYLPPPETRREPQSLADIYDIADEPRGPNSTFWIAVLETCGKITLDQLVELLETVAEIHR